MTNIVNVTLDTRGDQPVLQLDGSTAFFYDPLPRFIVWKLHGNLVGGSFMPIGVTQPGFAWNCPPDKMPAADIFGKPMVGLKEKLLWMRNYHPDNSSHGQWNYTLWVRYNGDLYSTPSPLVLTPTGPIIINHDQ